MRYNLKLLASLSIFLVSSPVEAVVTDNSSVTNNPSVAKSVVSEFVKIAHIEGKKQRRDEALRLSKLGMLQLNKGNWREALSYFEQALVIFQKNDDKAAILNNIGAVYLKLGEYHKALDYYQQSLAIKKQIGNKSGVGITLNNIGAVYLKLGEYAKALDYF